MTDSEDAAIGEFDTEKRGAGEYGRGWKAPATDPRTTR
jgi:hypothetical protein